MKEIRTVTVLQITEIAQMPDDIAAEFEIFRDDFFNDRVACTKEIFDADDVVLLSGKLFIHDQEEADEYFFEEGEDDEEED